MIHGQLKLLVRWLNWPTHFRNETEKCWKSKPQLKNKPINGHKFWKSKTHLRNQMEKFWKSKNHFRNQMEKFWKSKKLLKKSNGQILEIKNSFQKLINWANFGNQKFISEIKRTNFKIKNLCTLEIMRTDFGNQKIISAIKRRNFGKHWKNPVINQADNQRIKANNYFSDAPRTP